MAFTVSKVTLTRSPAPWWQRAAKITTTLASPEEGFARVLRAKDQGAWARLWVNYGENPDDMPARLKEALDSSEYESPWLFLEPTAAVKEMCSFENMSSMLNELKEYHIDEDFSGVLDVDAVLQQPIHVYVAIMWRDTDYEEELHWTLLPPISKAQAHSGLLSIQRFLTAQENTALHGTAPGVRDALVASKVDPIFQTTFLDLAG